MTSKPICLIDQTDAPIASLEVQLRDDHYEGVISLDRTPPPLRKLFEQFEEVVEGQMFSLLDDIEEKIGALSLRVRFNDATEAEVADLQVFPSTNAVSFKVRETTAAR